MLVYGKNVLFDTNPKMVRKVYLSSKKVDSKIMNFLQEHHLRYQQVSLERMNQMVDGNHQGVVLDIYDYEYASLEECFSESFVLVLDHLEDPHNLGAIIRSAEAFGIRYVIIPKDRSVRVNETVMKVSAGALNRVRVIMVTNLAQTVEKLKKEDFMIYATDMKGVNYRTFSYSFKKVLIIGNEGKGVQPLLIKKSDEVLCIPMRGQVNSLNASVAAGILMSYMMGES